MEIISRKEAKELGLTTYFTGNLCKRGHVSVRYVSTRQCKECQRENKNTPEAKLNNKKYYLENKDRLAEYKKEYYQQNREQELSRIKDYYHKNKESRKEYARKYYQDNKEEVKESRRAYNREYRRSNRDKINKYRKERYWNDLAYKTDHVCRRLISRTLRSTELSKNSKTYELLGYSHDELLNNMERKFLLGMSWDNYGEWHIDHKKPISRFVDEGITDPSIINSLDNLIPMWAGDNIQKLSNTLDEYLDQFPDKYILYGKFL